MYDFCSNDNCLFVPEKNSDKLIVIFSGFNAKSFTGYKLFSEYKINKLFIRDPKKNWYNYKIDDVSKDADDLKDKIYLITKQFSPKNITFFGSSMGGYAALLFGLKLNVGKIVTFGPQLILNSSMPNNPSDMNKIIYPDIYKLLDENTTTDIDIYFGSEDVVDIYNLHRMPYYKEINLYPIYGAPHDIMAYFHQLGLLKKVLRQYIDKSFTFDNLYPTYQLMKNQKLLKLLKDGVESFYKNDFSTALFYMTEIVLHEPSWSGGWAFLAKVQLNLKLYDKALDSLNRSFEIFYNTEYPHFDAGLIYLEKKEYEKAEYEIKQALRFATTQKSRHIIKLVIALREQGKICEAFSYLDIIRERNSSDFGYLFQSGRLHLLRSNYESATYFFTKALERKPNNSATKKFLQQAQEEYSKTSQDKTYKLFATGDCMLARRMHYFYEDKPLEWIVNDIPTITKECNIVMTNLESVISNQGHISPKGDRRPFVFRGSPELLNILHALDVNLVTTANNHSVDYGEEALLQQKEILDTLGIASPGSGKDILSAKEPVYFKHDDITIAFISIFSFYESDKYTASENKAGVFHLSKKDIILKELEALYIEADKYADLVVLSPHWMKNWTNQPTKAEQELARDIIDVGYDAIIGHSSHILHGMEVYKDKPIIYDMGTLLIDNISGHKEMTNSASFVLSFNKSGFKKVEIYPITLKNGKVYRTKNQKDLNIQKANYIYLSKMISDETVFTQTDEKLFIELHPSKNIENKLHITTSFKFNKPTKTIDKLQLPRPVSVLEKLPSWAQNNQININFDDKFILMASKGVDVFHAGTSFLLQSVLKVHKFNSTDRWEVHIVGKHVDGIDSFEDYHPISHGIYNPSKWSEGQLVLDEAALRPKTNLLSGKYNIFFGFINMNTKEYLKISNSNEIYANIGIVEVVDSGVPKFASGIDWNGQY